MRANSTTKTRRGYKSKIFVPSCLNKIFVSSWLILLLCLPASAETVEFADTVRVVMGSRESQDEVRVYATQEAKRRVLDKVGVYLSGSTEIVRRVEEATTLPRRHEGDTNNKNFVSSWSDSSTVLQRIQTLTVGVVQTEVVSEEWKTEGGSFVLYLVCRVKVDPEDALNRLTELLKDKEKVEDYQKVQVEVERLRTELAQLRKDLDSAKSEKETKAVKEEVQTAINGLTAAEWFYKGVATTNLDDKIACYSISTQMSPNLIEAYNNRGGAYKNSGDYDRAIADFNHILETSPNFVQAYYAYFNRGLTYINTKEYDKAILDFNCAIQLNPNMAETYTFRGVSYANKSDHDLALKDYNWALQIDPYYAEAHFRRGLSYSKLQDYGHAIVDFDHALALDLETEKQVGAYFCRALTWIVQGDTNRAIADFSSALQIDPNYAKAYYLRGLEYAKKQDYSTAVKDLERAAALGNEEAKQLLKEMEETK